ncbi:MAG: diacylglycerol kinase family lipid kinase [Bacteroidales bacterium]|nr:diacylglycerol kinase family lipid kinase [Bacteroidales bacterium]
MSTTHHINTLEPKWQILLNINANENTLLEKWVAIAQHLKAAGFRYQTHHITAIGEGTATAARLCREGARHLIAAGGDGTINEVVNGIFTSGVETRDVYLAILPMGRGNDMVRTHQYPKNTSDCVNILQQGNFLKHDIGMVRVMESEELVRERHFINIAGFGFDGEVIHNVTYRPKKLPGLSVYMSGLITTLLKRKAPTVQITGDDDKTFSGKIFMALGCICQYNGGGMREAKTADPQDGLMDIIIVKDVSTLRVLWHLKDLKSGNHVEKMKQVVEHWQTRFLTITSPDRVYGEVEGEVLPYGDYQISIIPNALNVLTNIK